MLVKLKCMEEARRQLSSAVTHTNSECLRDKSWNFSWIFCVTCVSYCFFCCVTWESSEMEFKQCICNAAIWKQCSVFLSQPHLLLAIHREFSVCLNGVRKILFTWPFLSSLKGSPKLEVHLVFKSGGFACRFVKEAEHQGFLVADMSYLNESTLE